MCGHYRIISKDYYIIIYIYIWVYDYIIYMIYIYIIHDYLIILSYKCIYIYISNLMYTYKIRQAGFILQLSRHVVPFTKGPWLDPYRAGGGKTLQNVVPWCWEIQRLRTMIQWYVCLEQNTGFGTCFFLINWNQSGWWICFGWFWFFKILCIFLFGGKNWYSFQFLMWRMFATKKVWEIQIYLAVG